jgi:hypothetical protein
LIKLTDPVQNAGHTAFRALPAPCGSHAERYGVRTARGTECGLKGVAVHENAFTVDATVEASASAIHDRRVMVAMERSLNP